MRTKVTNDQIEFIKLNYEYKGTKYCCENLKLKKSTVIAIARRNGISVNRKVAQQNMSKSIINVNSYINVDQKEIAYILGLIWTDGCVTYANNKSKTPIIKHCCILSDAENLNLIFNTLHWRKFNSENNKSIGKNTMNTNWISSRELGEYLVSHNYRDKNKGTEIYKIFPDLINHFLRGLFDGDGCITMSKVKEKYMQFAIYFSSTSLQDWSYLSSILSSINVKYKIRYLSDKLGSSSQLCIHDSVSIYNLCEFMYKDSDNIRLERKYVKYLSFTNYKKRINTLQ